MIIGVFLFVLSAHAQVNDANHSYLFGDEKLEADLNESYEGDSAEYEYQQIKIMFDDAVAALAAKYNKPTDKVLRDAHAKAHGCVKARFTVENKLIPENLRVGIYEKNRSYDAWVRFSNNHSDATRHDNIDDLRGMSIKLMGVKGKKILFDESEATTQDLLMFGSPVFFLQNNKDYKIFLDFINQGVFGALESAWSRYKSIPSLVAGFIDVKKRLANIANITNPLNIKFFSATPYRLGERSSGYRRALKFGVERVTCGEEAIVEFPVDKKDPRHPNYLRESLVKSLNTQDACFDFKIQFHDRQIPEAVEDPRVEWKTPFIKVASLKIKKQVFDTEAQNEFCENLSFTPWHALPEHRPLGRTNRARGYLYHVISEYRHTRNGAVRKEPSGF